MDPTKVAQMLNVLKGLPLVMPFACWSSAC